MRVILDTNVFVSGVFFAGPPYRILEAWRDGELQLVVSQEILEEYQRKVMRPRQFIDEYLSRGK